MARVDLFLKGRNFCATISNMKESDASQIWATKGSQSELALLPLSS